MGDGFWPRLYGAQGLTQPIDYGKLANMSQVFDDFKAPNYPLLQAEGGSDMIAAPNCWGGYGFTVNMDKVAEEDADSVSMRSEEHTSELQSLRRITYAAIGLKNKRTRQKNSPNE